MVVLLEWSRKVLQSLNSCCTLSTRYFDVGVVIFLICCCSSGLGKCHDRLRRAWGITDVGGGTVVARVIFKIATNA